MSSKTHNSHTRGAMDTVTLYQVADFRGGKPVIRGRPYQQVGMSRFGGYTDIVFRKLTPEQAYAQAKLS